MAPNHEFKDTDIENIRLGVIAVKTALQEKDKHKTKRARVRNTSQSVLAEEEETLKNDIAQLSTSALYQRWSYSLDVSVAQAVAAIAFSRSIHEVRDSKEDEDALERMIKRMNALTMLMDSESCPSNGGDTAEESTAENGQDTVQFNGRKPVLTMRQKNALATSDESDYNDDDIAYSTGTDDDLDALAVDEGTNEDTDENAREYVDEYAEEDEGEEE